MSFILASKSPRRREYLTRLGIPFRILTAETDETLPSGIHPREGVGILAARKADALPPPAAGEVIIAADTLVELDGVALGKPKDELDAAQMLSALSGRAHRVHTGVAVRTCRGTRHEVESTTVVFKTLTKREIADYVDSGEPLDKAGAYGIQGAASAFVESIDGAFDNVVGLPCDRLLRMLQDEGVWPQK